MAWNRNKSAAKQGGKSAIGNLIVLVLIVFGIWVGIQYIPQRIEAGAVGTILDQVQKRHANVPFRDDRDLQSVINNHLSLNEMRDMRDNIKTSWSGNTVTITVDYSRELNLLFTKQTIEYHEELVLR